MDNENIIQLVQDVLHCESEAIAVAASRVDQSVREAIELLARCPGRLIVTGMGKMGLIGRKAAATFSSTGTPAIYLHPVDALHGDLGIVSEGDVVLALSNSGTTEEVVTLMAYLKRRGVDSICMTGRVDSQLAQICNLTIDTSVEKEADPETVAPTASSTVALAMCDALAVALMKVKGFTAKQFAEFHPGGSLGKKMLMRVADVMRTGDQLPQVDADTRIRDALVIISQKAMGCALVMDSGNRLLGILTDGDLRRILEKFDNPLRDPVSRHMTEKPTSIESTSLAVEALREMEKKSISVLPVVDDQQVVGAIHLHQLLAAGLT